MAYAFADGRFPIGGKRSALPRVQTKWQTGLAQPSVKEESLVFGSGRILRTIQSAERRPHRHSGRNSRVHRRLSSAATGFLHP